MHKKTKPKKWLRILLPSFLIILWLAVAGIGGPYFGKVSEVASNDQASYLPASAEATKAQELIKQFNDSEAIPAIVLFVSDTQLTNKDMQAIADSLENVAKIAGVAPEMSPAISAEDGMAAQVFVQIESDAKISEVVNQISATLQSKTPEAVSVYVTGPAGFTADLITAFSGIDGILLAVALIAVFVILILVYRSLILPVAVLSTSIFALTAALLTVWWLAKWEILMLSGQTQGILFILVIGAATDYSLLFVARYKEELRLNADKASAVKKSISGSAEPIIASGSTVIAGLLCLLLSDLKSNSSLGPVAAIGIVFAMLAALTLLPALLYAFGRASFWPQKPKYDPALSLRENVNDTTKGFWSKVAQLVKKRPRTIWLATTAALILGTFGVSGLNASGVAQSELVLGSSEARDGQELLGKHFPGGSGSPVQVVTAAELQDTVMAVMQEMPGIDSVSVQASTADRSEANVVNGQVLLQGTLAYAADSNESIETVKNLRAELQKNAVITAAGSGSAAGAGSGAESGSGSGAAPATLVGGITAIALDTNEASIKDRNLIIPIVLLVITLILMVLLRSVLAPILLIATTVLSFGTAMGVSALVFNKVFEFPGADPAVPLFGFIFLVALGIDYNIFLMTRVREESKKHGTREGILRGLTVTGGVITSAGIVLAATFAALAVIPILFLLQLAFIVAFGVLLDTFIVRSFLVPALAYDLGARVWWPSKLSRI